MDFDQNIINKAFRAKQFEMESLLSTIEKTRYRRKPISLHGCLNSLSSAHRTFAIADYVCDHNLSAFKQNLYLSSLCAFESWKDDAREALWTPRHLWDALLSDSREAIQAMANFSTLDLQNPHPNSGSIYSRIWQAAILGGDEVIRELLLNIEKKGHQDSRKTIREGQDFFTVLLNGDKNDLQAHILQAVNVKPGYPEFDDFIAHHATAQAKLCHIRGIPVEIDHPRVPMDLVRIAPLPHYDDVYDFLAPGYEPPPEGLFGHLKSWIKKK
jgi:Immunity protein 49